MFVCPRCHYRTKWKGNFKTHLNRKISCTPIYSSESIESILLKYGFISNTTSDKIEKYKCQYCDKSFKYKSGKCRHEKNRCKMKRLQLIENNKRIEHLTTKLLPQIKNILEETNIGTIDLSNHTLSTNSINVTNIQNQTNNQLITNIDNSNNLQIHNYGQEDLSHITDQQYKEMLQDPFNAMSKLMNAIHFNDQKPENQNLRIPNIKQPFVEVFEDGDWIVSNQYKLLCKAYTVKKEILHQAFLRIQEQLDEQTKKLYYEYRQAANCDLFTVQSQITDIKAAIISGTRHKNPVPSRYALRQTCSPIITDKINKIIL